MFDHIKPISYPLQMANIYNIPKRPTDAKPRGIKPIQKTIAFHPQTRSFSCWKYATQQINQSWIHLTVKADFFIVKDDELVNVEVSDEIFYCGLACRDARRNKAP